MVTNPPTDERREAFEKWLRSKWTPGYGCAKRPDGEYVDNKAQFHWNCWQAAILSQGDMVSASSLEKLASYWENGGHRTGVDYVNALQECADHLMTFVDGQSCKQPDNLTALISKAEKV